MGIDLLDWLDTDLRPAVDLVLGAAEVVLRADDEQVDRLLMVETLEHLEAPWCALRAAARRLAPGGRLVITTPNIATMRHRIELLVGGRLTSFRPGNLPHLTPVLPHVVRRVLSDEGIEPELTTYAGRDVVPLTGGLRWPEPVHRRMRVLTSVSVLVVGRAPMPAE
jgi:SAM-dependent methyltransferase